MRIRTYNMQDEQFAFSPGAAKRGSGGFSFTATLDLYDCQQKP
jgi:hypothetical protein